MTPEGTRAPSDTGWHRRHWALLAVGFIVGIAIRVVLLPTDGLRGDIDQFAGWVHTIATRGLGTLYDGTEFGPVTFGPVMAYVWGILAAVEPGFRTATDASDPALRALMKIPASLADLGLAAGVAVGLRTRPTWAVIGALAILLHPAIWYVSAWWGQCESIFVLSGLGAVLAAASGRPGLAAALVAVSLMTKPQAIPFVLPFAAWFWATGGVRGVAKASVIGLVVIVVLWLPFIPSGGPIHYLEGVATYQRDVFNVLSLRAWNPWWILQEVAAGGAFIRDDIAFLGPLTLRHIGYAVTGILSLVIAWRIVRDPRPSTLILGLAASVLVFFTFMTQMHERYAYAAVVFLMLLIPDRRVRWIAIVFGAVFTLNLVAAVPATEALAELVPVSGPLSIAGSLVLTAAALVAMRRINPAAHPVNATLPKDHRRTV
jgi:hypothetical protein